MGDRPTGGRLQFRVSVPPSSPVHAALAPLPPAERPAALVRLAEAEAARAPAEARLAEALDRLAGAVERWSEVAARLPSQFGDDGPGSGADGSPPRDRPP